jgi:endoglucanase
MGKYWNEDVVRWLVWDWKVSVVRLAMAADPSPGLRGYLDEPLEQKKLVETVVEAAIDVGIYAIIDWHTYNATPHEWKAKRFFGEMASKYGRYPNVLFEPFNEPTTHNWTTEIKPYFERVVNVIRMHSNNLILLGTRTWSQDVDIASENPVEGENLAYVLHFYAASHKEYVRQKALKALANNLTVFVTEWGTCDYTGNGTLDFPSSRIWLDFLETHGISWCNWAISDKYEACSALLPNASTFGNWSADELTFSGKFMRNQLRDEDIPVYCSAHGWPCLRSPCAMENAACKEEKCCSAAGQQCFGKDEGWAQCMLSCTPGIHDTDAPPRSPWSCTVLEPESFVLLVYWPYWTLLLLVICVSVGIGGALHGICGRWKRVPMDETDSDSGLSS